MERNLLKTYFLLAVLSIITMASTLAHANEESMEQIKLLVADAFRYPAGKLKIAPKETPNGRTSLGVESDDRTFFPVTFDMGRRGSVLKPQFEAQLAEMIKKSADQKEKTNSLRKVQLSDQGYAYFGIGAVGPGGAQSSAVFVFPKLGIDLGIMITIPGEDTINIEAAPKEYQALMSENSPDMVDRITHLAEQVAALSDAATGPQQSESSAPPNVNPPPSVQSPAAKQAPETKPAPIPSEEPTSSTPWSIIVVLIMAATGLLWLLVKMRK